MKTRIEVSADKLRGGFYTSPDLARLCLARASELLGRRSDRLRVLEPSSGDGAFIRALASDPSLRSKVDEFVAIELIESEAKRSAAELESSKFAGRVQVESALSWSVKSTELFDLAVGNPPYVRFQFVDESDRRAISALGERIGVTFRGVSNLWIPLLLGALSRLRDGGVFSFVIPTECFTGISASVFRGWLTENASRITVDFFEPKSFPGVLQEVVVLSGKRGGRSRESKIKVIDHTATQELRWSHLLRPSDDSNWTRYLLSPSQLSAIEEAHQLPVVQRLGALAKFEVATVTGANDFFSVDQATLKQFRLEQWARPLLPRTRHAPGLAYTDEDHNKATVEGANTFLLDFNAELPDPSSYKAALGYLSMGEADGLPDRYKCRIREPWYRVPVVPVGELMLSKRSHLHPRLILNEVGAVTTDTIYRGRMIVKDRSGRDLAASFHSSLTMLSAELEGRSFGGGVLELVPSEVNRLLVAVPPEMGKEMHRLDAISRNAGGLEADDLIEETDRFLIKADVGFDDEMIGTLSDALLTVRARRLGRSIGSSARQAND